MKNFKFNLNQVAFIIMCTVMCISGVITINCKIQTNKFIESYNTKYEELRLEVDSLKEITGVTKLNEKTQTTFHSDYNPISMISSIINTNDLNTPYKKDDGTSAITSKTEETNTDTKFEKTEDSLKEAKANTQKEDKNVEEEAMKKVEMSNNLEATASVEFVDLPKVSINTYDLTTKSNLTSDQFNTLIENVLTDRGYSYTDSSLYNIGESLYNMEQTYDVNGLFALAVGSLESGYGTSYLAQNKNNLFGISGGSGYRGFDSINESIQYFGNLISENYIGCDRTTIGSIGSKYCPGSSKWVSDVSWFFNMYGENTSSIILY